jgi:hypothetical protein
MKKYFILAAFALTSFVCKAQSNLQLNQVLTYNGALTSNQSSPTWTVPNGKVWKVEARTPDYLKINGRFYTGGYYTYGNGNLNGPSIALPIWLKSGDVLQYQFNNNTTNGFDYFISILEFSLTQ